MSIVIDPAALEAISRDLLRHDLAVADAAAEVFAPDTGETSGRTADGVAVLLERARAVADGLHGIADALDAAVGEAWTADGHVSGVFDALTTEGLS
jgi:hypothetical protein